jgi:hypothetical protein
MGGLMVAHFQTSRRIDRRVKKLFAEGSSVVASRYNLVCGLRKRWLQRFRCKGQIHGKTVWLQCAGE